MSDGHLSAPPALARDPHARGDHVHRLRPGAEHAGHPADGADGRERPEPQAQPRGPGADEADLRPRPAVARGLSPLARKRGPWRSGPLVLAEAAGDDAHRRADRSDVSHLGHGARARVAAGRAAGALCLGPQRHGRREGHEPPALRPLFIPHVRRGALPADRVFRLAAGHSLGASALRHERSARRRRLGRVGRRRRPPRDPSDHLPDLREPRLRQPLHQGEHGGGGPPGLHPHGACQGGRDRPRALPPCLPQHAHSARHASGPLAARADRRLGDH